MDFTKNLLAASVASCVFIHASANAAPTLEEVIVTAQKREQSMQDVGISVTAMSGENMSALGVNNSADIARFTPNLNIANITGEGNQPAIFLRGVGLNDFNTNNSGPVGMYVDEVIVSAPSAQAFAMLDAERVEVLRGPQGTLYGRNTTGGAINVISNKPTEEFEASALLRYGNFDATKVEATVSGPFSDSVGGRLAVVSNTADGYIDDVGTGKEYNETNNYSARALLQWDASESVSTLFNVHYGKTDTDAPRYIHYGRFDANTFNPDFGIFEGLCSSADVARQASHCVSLLGYQDNTDDDRKGEWSKDGELNFDVLGGSAKVNWDINDSLSFVSITGYDEVDKIHAEDSDSGPDNWLEVTFGTDSKTFTQEFRLVGQGESSNWLLGAFYLDEELNQDQTADIGRDLRPLTGFDPDLGVMFSRHQTQQDTQTWALYGQYEYAFSEQWVATVGLRYTQETKDFTADVSLDEPGFSIPIVAFEDDIDNDNTSGRLALNYFPNEDWMIYGSLTTGFKSGGFPGVLGFAPQEYEGYDPEEIIAYELGFKSTLASGLVQLNGAAFFYDYTDMQVFQLIEGGTVPGQKLTNAGESEIYGAEFELTSQPTEGVYLMLGVGYTHSEFKELDFGPGIDLSGNTLANAPEWNANGLARYDWQLNGGGGLHVQADFTYTDDYFFDAFNNDYTSQEAYTLWGARAGWVASSGNWEVALWGQNLTDEDYFSTGLDLGPDFGLVQMIPTRPRAYGLELKAYFN